MKFMIKNISAIALSLSAFTAFATAAPQHLTTVNDTDEQSNAYIAGIPSPYPTEAHSTHQVFWNMVRIACYGHTTNGRCFAVIKMATNTSNPVEVGTVSMDLSTGDISPKVLSANGYTLTVEGPGRSRITKN